MSGMSLNEGLLALAFIGAVASSRSAYSSRGTSSYDPMPFNCDYIPVVSTITGIAQGIFWGACFVGASVVTLATIVATVPCWISATALNIFENNPHKDATIFLFTAPLVAAAVSGTFACLSAAKFTRAAISTVPLFGNITLIMWDSIIRKYTHLS